MFFYSQPLLNERRLLSRKRIKALCVQDGLPTIWFTINPNNITNPIKIHLGIHRSSIPKAEAEKFLNDMVEGIRVQSQHLQQSAR
jgi:hypothetical protein